MFEALANRSSPSRSVLDELALLVEDMQQGNQNALESLYDATVGKLYALASAILRHAEDAEEVVCATYAQAWESASSYDAQRGSVLGWLLTICRSRALDQLRKRRVRIESQDGAAIDQAVSHIAAPEDLLSLMQQTSRVRAALATLTVERRQLVSLAFLSDLSHHEIATHTGIPLGTVKSHLRRALLQLREHLESLP